MKKARHPPMWVRPASYRRPHAERLRSPGSSTDALFYQHTHGVHEP
ncbi:hypothetical protein J2853_001735 [Streptosporangium lutulentum]|uniref:Uncharacterized protein n=1 Tax=Streptosporangium lutulentum TaxID=1461250 RepID=A0ABT9Q8X0_9ACTN|nr:hypothetical protein [Streptosporangium lutulentum]